MSTALTEQLSPEIGVDPQITTIEASQSCSETRDNASSTHVDTLSILHNPKYCVSRPLKAQAGLLSVNHFAKPDIQVEIIEVL